MSKNLFQTKKCQLQIRNNDWNNLSLLLTYSGFIYLKWRSGKNTWIDSRICRENNKVKKYDKNFKMWDCNHVSPILVLISMIKLSEYSWKEKNLTEVLNNFMLSVVYLNYSTAEDLIVTGKQWLCLKKVL